MNGYRVIFTLGFLLTLISCTSNTTTEEPDAFLIADGKKYSFVLGSSCWGNLCQGSSWFTKSEPVTVSVNSKFQLAISGHVNPDSLILIPIPSKFLTKNSPPDMNGYYDWSLVDNIEEIAPEKPVLELKPLLKQNLPLKLNEGLYVLELNGVWKENDASYSIYINVIQ